MTVDINGSVSKSWLARHMGVRFDYRYYFDPLHRRRIDSACNEYVRDYFGPLPVFYTESNLGQRAFYSDNQVLVGGIQPNLILGMLVGAEFIPAPEADADISLNCLSDRDVEQLPSPSDMIHKSLVEQFDRQIHELERHAGSWRAIPPFFWDTSGRATIHGVLTTAFKLQGDQFLMDAVSESENAQSLLTWVNSTLLQLVDHFSKVGDLPITGVHIGECAACMIDERLFRRAVMPAAAVWGERFGNLRFHSCGCIDHLLAALTELDGLHSLDVGGETSVARIRQLFGRGMMIGIAPLVSQLQAPTAAPLLNWLRTVISQNDGGPLAIGYHLEEAYNTSNILRLHEALDRL